MILVFVFMSLLLSSLPGLHSIKDGNNSCAQSFNCSSFGTLKYPFYNTTNTRCGLIKVHCTSKGGQIQIGRRWYEIVDKSESHNQVLINDTTFDHLVKMNSCEALMNNFTSSSPLLYTITIFPLVTLFKCTKNNLISAQQTDAYFKQHHYNSYNRCDDHNFYYKYLNETVPSDLPHKCRVVQLPAKVPEHINETDIFSLLTSLIPITFKLAHSCSKCHEKLNGQCASNNGVFQCLDAKKDNHHRKIIILVTSGLALILMLSIVMYIIWRLCKSSPFSYVSPKNKSLNLEDISYSLGVYVFSYKELEDATQNFDPSRELGDGGFGAVYYGKLQDGREVAVKKLHEHNYNRVQQFRNEVEILTKLRHPNLVVLYGCTSRESRELLLVYEYVANGTVFDHLHGEKANSNLLTWPIRLNIAIETASALVYLHASEIIHRDVKPTNILLDHNFSVKVADFGLSRLISNNVTHVSTAPQGTPGYVDPQYHQRYQLTDKSDVYSFGVVLIELISSMVAVDLNRSIDEISLANFALKRIQRCEIDQLIDPALGYDTNPQIKNMITAVAELAFQCLQHENEMRPTMNEVLDVLMDIQVVGTRAACDSTRDFRTVHLLPLSETKDSVVLLKEFRTSPVSVTSKWQSNSSTSTTRSNRGDRSSVKNGIST